MLLGLLLAAQIIVSLMLIVVVLLQRSEGGVLGQGGGPSGFMTARGAGDFMTRITWILGASFFIISLVMTVVSGRERGDGSVADRIKVDALNPESLNRAPATPPAGTAQPGNPLSAPSPLQAPTPTVRNPFLGDAPAQPAPAAPAPAPAQQ